jgi:hypothetical protein
MAKKATVSAPVNRVSEVIANGHPKGKEEKILIPSPRLEMIQVTVDGIAPLVMRNWDDKTKQQLADKQSGKNKAPRREDRDPKDVLNAARYISTEGWDGVPAAAFKGALVRAVSILNVSKTDLNMTIAKLCFFIQHDGTEKPRVNINACTGESEEQVALTRLLKINGKMTCYEKMQPTDGGGPYMSYRPLYDPWSVRLRVQYNGAIISRANMLNLISHAGYFVGIGEHRPSAKESHTGEFGRWEIRGAE